MEAKYAHFVHEKFNLPMFMVTKNRLRLDTESNTLRNYIESKKSHFISTWTEDRDIKEKSATIRQQRHILGADPEKPKVSCRRQEKPIDNAAIPILKPWALSPNRYGLETKPFESRGGLSGAYWRQSPSSKPRKTKARKPSFRLYDLPRESDKMHTRCHKLKSQFLSNPRDRPPTSRGMVTELSTAYRNPDEPGPATYTLKKLDKTYEIHKPSRPPHPHVFYRKSIVALRPNSIHPPNISFLPGPGRYETRYRNVCACVRNRKYLPGLDLLIEKQRRLRFRRKPYEKIKPNLYCSPDLRHIEGDGHRHLFMGAPPPRKAKKIAETKEKKAQLKMFHDAKYLQMVCHPVNDLGSIRTEPMPQIPTRIKFDRMVKVVSRKQLRSNRKLAFGSSCDRWPDDEKPAVVTPEQIKEMKKRLPLDRRLRTHPIMTKAPEEIESRLSNVPLFLLPNYIPKLRKRLFKFLPMPDAKILISTEDIRPKDPSPHGYYYKPVDPKIFFKDRK